MQTARLDCTGGEDSENDLFTVNHRERGNTKVKRNAVNRLGETAVLRDTLFSDIHTGDQLQTGGELILDVGRNIHQRDKVAVDTDTDLGVLLERLEVNIRCFHTECIFDDLRCELNDRGALNTVSRFFIIYHLALRGVDAEVAEVGHLICLTDRLLDCGTGCQNRNTVITGLDLDIFKNIEVHRIIRCNGQTAAGLIDRDNAVALCKILRDHACDLTVNLDVVQVNKRCLQLDGQCLREFDIRHEAHLDDDFTKLFLVCRFALSLQHLLQLFRGDVTFLDEVVTDADVSHNPTSKKLLKNMPNCGRIE